MSAASKAAQLAVPWLERAFGQTFKLARTAWMPAGAANKAALAAKWQRLGQNAAGPVSLVTGATFLGWAALQVNDMVNGTKKAAAAAGEMVKDTGESLDKYALYSLIGAGALVALSIYLNRKRR